MTLLSCPRNTRIDANNESAQPLRRQRGAYVGFDLCDIHRVDQAIRIHVLAEIRTRDRLPHLRFSQAHIGGINDGITVYISN